MKIYRNPLREFQSEIESHYLQNSNLLYLVDQWILFNLQSGKNLDVLPVRLIEALEEIENFVKEEWKKEELNSQDS